jgi:hypothetical protein
MDIKAGDLVMVVRPNVCCGSTKYLGHVATVVDVAMGEASVCLYCGDTRSVAKVVLSSGVSGDSSRVRKIDPPALPESITKDQELTV